GGFAAREFLAAVCLRGQPAEEALREAGREASPSACGPSPRALPSDAEPWLGRAWRHEVDRIQDFARLHDASEVLDLGEECLRQDVRSRLAALGREPHPEALVAACKAVWLSAAREVADELAESVGASFWGADPGEWLEFTASALQENGVEDEGTAYALAREAIRRVRNRRLRGEE
ncbi:MAG: hypothetical protein WHU10_11380, partial [Fimbriimonadales bacterium]